MTGTMKTIISRARLKILWGGKRRVLRGGSWEDDPKFVRVSNRFVVAPNYEGRLTSGFGAPGTWTSDE